MTVLTNSFEGGTAGTTITTSNSGGASGNAFDVVTVGSGAVLAYSNTQAAHGTLSGQFSTGASSVTDVVEWSTSMGTQTQVWFRIYVYLTTLPSADFAVWRAYNSGTQSAGVNITTTGKVAFQNASNSQIFVTTNAIPPGQWYRLEGSVLFSATVGQVTLSLYSIPDTTIPLETDTSEATQNTGSQATNYRYGLVNGGANQAVFYLDDIGLSSTGYLGPASNPMAMFTDNFAVNDIAGNWANSATGAGITMGGGRVSIPCTPEYYNLASTETYNLTGSYALMQPIPSQGSDRETYLELTQTFANGNNKADVFYSGEYMYGRLVQGGTVTTSSGVAYNPVNHAWWRIRESGGTLYYDTAPDAVTWTNLWSSAYSIAVTSLYVNLDTGYYSTDVTTTSYLQAFNTGNKMAVLADNFAVSDLVTLWDNSTAGVSISGGRAVIPVNTSGTNLKSTHTYDLTGSYVLAQMTPAPGTNFLTQMYAYTDSNDYAVLQVSMSGNIAAVLKQAGTSTTIAATAYNPAVHVWWRIRESAGVIYWDTAPDGATWTNLGSSTYTINVTQMYGLVYTVASSGTGTAYVQNFNVPAGSTPINGNPTLIGAAPVSSSTGPVGQLYLNNTSATAIYLGGPGVSASNGVEVLAAATWQGPLFAGDQVYAVTASGNPAIITVLQNGA